jgi:hypothetical protein
VVTTAAKFKVAVYISETCDDQQAVELFQVRAGTVQTAAVTSSETALHHQVLSCTHTCRNGCKYHMSSNRQRRSWLLAAACSCSTSMLSRTTQILRRKCKQLFPVMQAARMIIGGL